MIRPGDVSADHEMPSLPAALVKQTLGGKVALTLRRSCRRPVIARAAARLRELEGPTPVPADADVPRDVILLPVGPREWDNLTDTLDSVAAYAPGARVVLCADGANDLRREAVARAWPDAVLLRGPHTSGGPPRLSPAIGWGYAWCRRHLRFDVLCKMDTDALLTGPGLLERAAQAFAADPALGMVGTRPMRLGGQEGDTTYSRWVLAHEQRWSPAVRRAVRAARAGGWAGEECHGGVYLLSRTAVQRLDDVGWLARNPPWWTLVGEDLWFSLGVAACGLRISALPGRVIISGQRFVPLSDQQVLDEGVLAIHSVKAGFDGAGQDAVRAFFRAARARAGAGAR